MEKGFVRKLWKFPVETQRATLRASGLTDGDIYEHGDGAQDIAACLTAFRKRPGTLKIAADMRVFGQNQDEITKVVDECETSGIKIVDLAHPELKTVSAQMRWAFARLAEWRRWGGDKAAAKRTGSQGGKIRGEIFALKRAAKFPEEAIRKLVAARGQKVTYRLIAKVTGISTGTLGRRYVEKKRKSRKARK